jgi:hypothetical protein
MNQIVSIYLTSAIDHQRGAIKSRDDMGYIQRWYDSIVRLNLNGVILHDDLSYGFIRNFPGVTFIKIDKVPKDVQLYDYRWLVYFEYINSHNVDNIFFTDISDVAVRRNPFTEIEDKLYCGDQPCTLNNNKWLLSSLIDPMLMALPDYYKIMTSDMAVLNCGILGGEIDIVSDFLYEMCEVVNKTTNRQKTKVGDMSLFNYVLYRYFPYVIHGVPVNSVFRKYEDRDDVWFIHK